MTKKKCPKCKKTKEISKGFGMRKSNGKKIPQSYCFDCRSSHGKSQRKLKQSKPSLRNKDLRKGKKLIPPLSRLPSSMPVQAFPVKVQVSKKDKRVPKWIQEGKTHAEKIIYGKEITKWEKAQRKKDKQEKNKKPLVRSKWTRSLKTGGKIHKGSKRYIKHFKEIARKQKLQFPQPPIFSSITKKEVN